MILAHEVSRDYKERKEIRASRGQRERMEKVAIRISPMQTVLMDPLTSLYLIAIELI